MTIEEAFGIVLRRMRKERNISQESLSESSKIDRVFISKIERGKQQPGLVTIYELAKALGLPACSLVFEVEFLLQCNGFTLKNHLFIDSDKTDWSVCMGDIKGSTSPYRGTESILIADDQKHIRDLISVFLVNHGYRVFHAEDGQEVVELFEKNLNEIDLVVMDIVMPRKDGISAYNEIKLSKPDMPIILMSGYHENHLNNSNPIPILQKPFLPSELVKRVRIMLDEATEGSQA